MKELRYHFKREKKDIKYLELREKKKMYLEFLYLLLLC